MSRLSRTLISTFGLGYMRPAPGTWGSTPAAALAGAFALLGHPGGVAWYLALAFVTVAFSVICVACGRDAETAFGRKDPSQAVADETAGMAVTLLLLPVGWLSADPLTWLILIAAAFMAFRIADIVKLWPAGALQRLPAGWGILIDDLVAGVQAAVPIWVLVYLLPHPFTVRF